MDHDEVNDSTALVVTQTETAGWRSFPPIVLCLIAISLFGATWRRWPNVIVDYGRELYVPWKLSQGQVLYKDIGHLFGPLAQLYNSLLFRIFPVSISTLAFSNFILAIALSLTIYFSIRRLTDTLTGFIAALYFLFLSAFTHFGPFGNYNFIAPYSHEAIFGASCVMFLCFMLIHSLQSHYRRDLVLAGLFWGLAFLTKPESFIAATGILLIWGALSAVLQKNHPQGLGSSLGLLLMPAVLSNAVFFLIFSLSVPLQDAGKALLGAWLPLMSFELMDNTFYRYLSGLTYLQLNLELMISVSVAAIGFFGFTLVSDLVCARIVRYGFAIRCLVFSIAALICLFIFSEPRYWSHLTRALPVMSSLSCVWFFWLVYRTREDPKTQTIYAALCLLSGLAVAFSLRMLFQLVLWHYGFIMALPSLVLLVVLLLWYLPRTARMMGGSGDICRLLNLSVLFLYLLVSLKYSNRFYAKKTFEVGVGQDLIKTYPDAMGVGVKSALAYIDAEIPREATFIVVPEGVMLNYLSRHSNPTPYTNFMPPELSYYGQERILQSFRDAPPDYFILVHKDSAEYGAELFGKEANNGKQIMDWIKDGYEPVHTIGEEPLIAPNRFGIKFLKRKAP